MIVLHVVDPNSAGSILANGLKNTTARSKGDDSSIIKTDRFLDNHCPRSLKKAGINRALNIYAYLVIDNVVINITNGQAIPKHDFIRDNQQTVLSLDIDARKCYVSDLDTYDSLKAAIKSNKNNHILESIAKSYWNKLVLLNDYKPGSIPRPEVIIPYEITPQHIELLSPPK